MNDGRREFVRLLVFFAAGAALAACGGDMSQNGGYTNPNPDPNPDPNPPGPPSCAANGGKASAITANHGHSLLVPAADFSAGVDQQYDIQGASLHDHFITLTAAQLAAIAGGATVTVTSTTALAHAHDVSVVCA